MGSAQKQASINFLKFILALCVCTSHRTVMYVIDTNNLFIIS